MWPEYLEYPNQLIALCAKATEAKPIQDFTVENGGVVEVDGSGSFIYIFEEVGGNPDETRNALIEFKATSKRKCPKVNVASNVLYVGSSANGLVRRISEHRGEGSEHTYALQLSHWFKGNYRIYIRKYDVDAQVLQIIEDSIAEQLKPAFGKRGNNGR